MTRVIFLVLLLLLTSCHNGLKKSYHFSQEPVMKIILSTGPEEKWTSKLKSYPQNRFVTNDSLLLIGDSRGGVSILDLFTGDRIDRYWRPFKRPIQLYHISDSILYLSSESEKEIIAWDLIKTSKQWKKKFSYDFYDLIHNDNMLFLKSDSAVASIHALSGEIQHINNMGVRLAKGFVLFDNMIYVCTEQGQLIALNSDLERIHETDLNIHVVEAISRQHDRLIVYNTDAWIRIFSLIEKKITSSFNFDKHLFSAPQISKNRIYMPFAEGRIEARTLELDSLLWSFSLQSLLNQNILVTSENIIIPFARGKVVSLHSDFGNELWRYDFGKSIDFVGLTQYGLLLGHGKELSMIGLKNGN